MPLKKHRNPFSKASEPEPSGTSQGICTGTLQNLTKHLLRQNPPEPHKVSAPETSGTSQGICPGTPPEPHHASSPRPSGTSSGSCTGNFRNLTRYQKTLEPNQVCVTLRNLTEYLHRKLPEPHEVSAPEPSGTSVSAPEPSGTAQNPPEPQQVSSLEPSGTSWGICTGTLRNLTRYLHQNPPEPCPEPGVEAAPDRTEANLG